MNDLLAAVLIGVALGFGVGGALGTIIMALYLFSRG